MATVEMRKPKPRRRSGIVIPHRPAWHQRLLAWLVFLLLRAVSLTVRFHREDRSEFLSRRTKPCIFCVWHSRLALCIEIYDRFVRPGKVTPGMAAMVSASKDGALLARILELLRVQPVRGSSSRRGPQALLELTSYAESGYDLAITPDGPRGPAYVVQEGIVALAQVTGLAIIPASYQLRWKVTLKSWDRFQIPLPFTRCDAVIAEPVEVPRDLTDEERERVRQQIERTLREISGDRNVPTPTGTPR